MTRTELTNRLAAHYKHLTHADIQAVVGSITAAIADTLAQGGRVEIRDFGVFTANLRPPRIGRNPRTGELAPVPAKRVTHFKPGRELRERVRAEAQSETNITPARLRELEAEPA